MVIAQFKTKLNNIETKRPFHEFSFKHSSTFSCVLDSFLEIVSVLVVLVIELLAGHIDAMVTCYVK